MNFSFPYCVTLLSMNFIEIYNDLFRTSQETRCASTAKANRFIQFEKIIVVRSEKGKKCKNIFYGLNTDFLNAKPNDEYCKHCVLKI
jgi:hypothetical protein